MKHLHTIFYGIGTFRCFSESKPLSSASVKAVLVKYDKKFFAERSAEMLLIYDRNCYQGFFQDIHHFNMSFISPAVCLLFLVTMEYETTHILKHEELRILPTVQPI